MKVIGISLFTLLVMLLSTLYGQSPNALGARNVQDYFQDVESKSYYQYERIQAAKGQMNDYSKRLHSLKEKFQKIFYGQSSGRTYKDPFDSTAKIGSPTRAYANRMADKEINSITTTPSDLTSFGDDSNTLAFNVDDGTAKPVEVSTPESISKSNKSTIEEIAIGRNSHSRKGYFILRPGFTFSYKRKVTNYPNYPGKTKVREYENGFSLLASGGFKFANGITLGGGAFHRVTKHDTAESYQAWPNQINYYSDGSESVSWGGFAELGYEYNLNEKIEFYTNIGLGYGVSITEKFFGKDVDDFVFATVGLGATWTPTDYFGLSLGYRYLHEEEVPAHAIELGLEGRF